MNRNTSYLTINEKLRTAHVKRWQIVRVNREQTLAEHLYRVWLIADEIALQMGLDDDIRELIGKWALNHDIPEVLTGDICTPVKLAMREAIPRNNPLRVIELELDLNYKKLYLNTKERHPIVLDIVKLADIIEAVDFLSVEAIGAHAQKVLIGLQTSVLQKLAKCRSEYSGLEWHKVSLLYSEIMGLDNATITKIS